MIKVGFIGAGNMGSALIDAISKTPDVKIFVSDNDKEKAAATASRYSASVSDNVTIAGMCDYIYLAVKPNIIPSVASEIKNSIFENATVVSMAAGVSLSSLEEMLGSDKKIIRIMPNTPVAVGNGVVLYCTNAAARISNTPETRFKTIMENAGIVDKIDEKLIDAASALSGCGPAFVYMFIEALADGAVECGLPRDKALLYASNTLIGSANMVLSTGKHPEQLKDEVCSPGGSTIEGVHALETGAFRGTTANAVVSAFEKTKKLGKK